MALRKLNTFSLVGNTDLDALMETENKSYRGLCNVSLTEMDTTVQPVIAAGSVVEINGALFVADANESISGTPADGPIYIKLIPAGSPATVTAQFTATAPIWDTEKQGWYSPTSGEENYRYLNIKMTKSGSSYSTKLIIFVPQIIGAGIIKSSGDLRLDNNAIFNGNVTFNGLASFGSTSIAGFLTNGTPFYKKQLTITLSGGAEYGTIAHGISSANTSNKILDVAIRFDLGTGDYDKKQTFSENSDIGCHLKFINWDDTNIAIYVNVVSGTPRYYLTVTYI